MTTDFHFRRAALLSALAAVYPAISYGAGAARIDFASGGVTAQQGPDSSRRSLTKGAEVFPGETITTNDGMAQLRFTDGARVSLKPGSEFRIDEYRFTGKADGEEKGFFSLIKGGLRTITGLVGKTNRASYQVKTTAATIGIRGTEYSVTYGNSINVNTAEGVVEVCNSQGCLLLYPGDEGYVQQDSTPPVLVQTGEEKPKKDDTPPELSDIEAPSNERNDRGEIAGFIEILKGIRNYTVNYAYISTISGPSPATAFHNTNPGNIDDSGALVDFQVSTPLWSPGSGGSTTSLGNDGIVAWGRWTAGTNGFLIANGADGNPGEYLHYVAGLPTLASDPATPISGTFSYSSIGGSASMGSTLGTINNASMTVTFGGAPTVDSYSIDVTAGSNYLISGSSPLSISNSGSMTFSGPSSGFISACSTCSPVSVSGAFYGSGATRAGLSFGFTDGLAPSPITGSVALKKN